MDAGKTKRSHKRKSRLDPKLKAVATTAFHLGISYAQEEVTKRAEKRLQLLTRPKHIHKMVWEVLTTLDKKEPTELFRIVISVKLAERIKEKLTKYAPSKWNDGDVKKLRKLIEAKNSQMAELLALCEEEIADII